MIFSTASQFINLKFKYFLQHFFVFQQVQSLPTVQDNVHTNVNSFHAAPIKKLGDQVKITKL